MFLTKIFAIVALYIACATDDGLGVASSEAQQECQSRSLETGRRCERPCSARSPCRKSNRECRCDGVCGLSCLKKECDPPVPPENGAASLQSRQIGSVVTYTCDSRFSLVGNAERTCTPEETWDGTDPTCRAQSCPRDESAISRQNRRCMRVCTTNDDCLRDRRCVCDDICGPSCIRTERDRHCPAIDTDARDSVVINPPNRVFASEATFSCGTRYEPIEGETMSARCLGNGEWSARCIPRERCGPPPAVPNANFVDGRQYYAVNDEVYYVCNFGYYRAGDRATLRCDRRAGQRSNQWTAPPFDCLPNRSCGDPGYVLNGRRIVRSNMIPSRVEYVCDVGYRMVGRGTRFCQSNREWSGRVPECRVVTCPCDLDAPEHGEKFGSRCQYNDVIFFECAYAFKIEGSQQLRCQADGTWDSQPPTCTYFIELDEYELPEDLEATNAPPLSRYPPGATSLTFVFDETGSMSNELQDVREGAVRILETTTLNADTPLYNFVLVPFQDPNVGPVIVTRIQEKFRRSIYDLIPSGGGDCPEMSITAIKTALEVSLPGSQIYVFTDASAKDYEKTDAVLKLIQETESQVIFILTGDCGDSSHEGYQAYEDIASTSSGQVFTLNKSDVGEILEYVELSVQTRRVNLISADTSQSALQYHCRLPVDSRLQQFTISVSGDDPYIVLRDPHGGIVSILPINSTDPPDGPYLEELLSLGKAYILTMRDPTPGIYQLNISSTSPSTTRVQGISLLNFKYGFTTERNLVDLNETSRLPLSGVVSQLIIGADQLLPRGYLTKVQFLNMRGHIIPGHNYTLQRHPTLPWIYTVPDIIPPGDYFHIRVKGIDHENHNFQRITAAAVSPLVPVPCVHQTRRNGKVRYNPQTNVPAHGTSRTLSCIEGFEITGDAATSSCEAGHWTASLPDCTEIGCVHIDVIPDTLVVANYSDDQTDGRFPAGTRVEFLCASNLHTITYTDGSMTKCRKGLWRGRYPTCTPGGCPRIEAEPAIVLYGGVSSQAASHPENTVAYIVCPNLTTHYPSSNRPSTCRNSSWEPAAPMCIPYRTCSAFAQQNEGIVSPSQQSYAHGSEVSFSCPDGKRLDGAPSSTCYNGTWTTAISDCVEKGSFCLNGCVVPYIVNGFYRNSRRTVYSNGTCFIPPTAGDEFLYIECDGSLRIYGRHWYSCEDGMFHTGNNGDSLSICG